MRLIRFIKEEPERTRHAILLLGIAFLTCFAALIASGIGGIYARNIRRERAASLAAAEMLALKDASDAVSAEVSAALAATHASDFLRDADARLFTEVIGARDARFFTFCTEVEAMIVENRFSASAFVSSLRESADTAGTLSRASARVQSPQTMAEPVGEAKDYTELAAEFIGVRNIFSADGHCAYCRNVTVLFDGASNRVSAYAIAAVPHEIRLTEEECIRIATTYAAGKTELDSLTLSSSRCAQCMCRVCLDCNGGSVVIGVRMDTGGIVYFFIRTEE